MTPPGKELKTLTTAVSSSSSSFENIDVTALHNSSFEEVKLQTVAVNENFVDDHSDSTLFEESMCPPVSSNVIIPSGHHNPPSLEESKSPTLVSEAIPQIEPLTGYASPPVSDNELLDMGANMAQHVNSSTSNLIKFSIDVLSRSLMSPSVKKSTNMSASNKPTPEPINRAAQKLPDTDSITKQLSESSTNAKPHLPLSSSESRSQYEVSAAIRSTPHVNSAEVRNQRRRHLSSAGDSSDPILNHELGDINSDTPSAQLEEQQLRCKAIYDKINDEICKRNGGTGPFRVSTSTQTPRGTPESIEFVN